MDVGKKTYQIKKYFLHSLIFSECSEDDAGAGPSETSSPVSSQDISSYPPDGSSPSQDTL